jgi:hypothetical protein
MSGTLREKLEAIAAARFDGYELFENDLIYFNASPADVAAISADLGLSCELYQPFRDFEGSPDAIFRKNLDRAERKFDVMQAVGAPVMLVCSNTSPQLIPDEERMAAQLYELAERAGRRNLRIGFEALAWGRAVNLYSQAWAIVKHANHPHVGLIVDSFHTLSLRDDPAAIANNPGDKISSCSSPTRRYWSWTCCNGRVTTATFPVPRPDVLDLNARDPDLNVGELSARAVDSNRPGQEATATAERANARVREEELCRPSCTCTEHMRSCSAAVIRSRQIGPHQFRQSEIRSCCPRRPSRDRRWQRLPQRKWLS